MSKKIRKVVAAIAITTIVGAAMATGLVMQNTAQAAESCDRINIIYCGVTSISNLQQIYASDKSGHAASPTVKHDYTDVDTIYAAQGITASMIRSMNSTNTFAGMVNKDGTVTIGSKVVGKTAKVSARYSVPGATPVAGTNAYIRLVTSDFQRNKPVLVRMDGNKMLYAIMTECGNGITAVPVLPPTPPTPPAPAPTYACTLLDMSSDNNTRKATITKFTTTVANGATYKNVVINWGDGSSSAAAATAVGQSHNYGTVGTYKVQATAYFTANGQTVSSTSESCAKSVTFTAPPVTETPPTYVCKLLDGTSVNDSRTVTISAFDSAATGNAVLNDITLDWGDSTAVTNTNIVGLTHTYDKVGTYTVRATANFTVNGKTLSSTTETCAKAFTFTTPPVTPPTPPSTPETPATPETPTVLPDTGVGNIAGLFAGTGVLGAFGHRVFTKRRLNRA